MSELLLRNAKKHSLDEFVAALPRLIGCDRWEERESSYYVEERYFRCIVLGVEVKAAIADDSEFKDWDLWLIFSTHGFIVDDSGYLDGLADCVARTLVLSSYEVLRPLSVRKGSGAVWYQLNPAAGKDWRTRIKTELIQCNPT